MERQLPLRFQVQLEGKRWEPQWLHRTSQAHML